VPGILKGGNLSFRHQAFWTAKEDVLILVAVKWRIKVDQIDRFIRDLLPEHNQIIAKVEFIHGPSLHSMRLSKGLLKG
jgi:hypothetical protein